MVFLLRDKNQVGLSSVFINLITTIVNGKQILLDSLKEVKLQLIIHRV